MSAFDHVAAIGPQPIWAGVTSRAVHGEQLTVTVIELDPGATVPEHSHANEQVGIMLASVVVVAGAALIIAVWSASGLYLIHI